MNRTPISRLIPIAAALCIYGCDSGEIGADGVFEGVDASGGFGTVGDTGTGVSLPKADLPELVQPGCSNDAQCAPGDGKLAVCLRSYCDLTTGLCAVGDAEEGKPCDDGEVCTLEDFCKDGSCHGGGIDSCDDENACTHDTCELTVGCAHEPLSGACDDGDPCTVQDTCVAGTCAGAEPLDCGDGDPCTEDGCDPLTGCTHTSFTGPCDDGDLCTDNDQCTNGICTGNAVACVDGIACTDDVCDPMVGCAYIPQESMCDDGDACTGDICDVNKGCVYSPLENGAPCDDGSACTEMDSCVAGACMGTHILCTSDNPCLDPICDFMTGCTTFPNVNPCDDLDPCTTNDHCSGGACTGTDDPWCGQGGCGDGLCDGALGESCESCPTDCGPCGGGGGGGTCGADPFYSCMGMCGSSGMGGCYCDDVCESYGDCCPDKGVCCGGGGGGGACGANPWDTCSGQCGIYDAFASCQCDDACENIGDCCSDKAVCCGGGGGGGGADNSCIWAFDGFCDEPIFCDSGTDCSDCGTCW